jgi:hypothetical protein
VHERKDENWLRGLEKGRDILARRAAAPGGLSVTWFATEKWEAPGTSLLGARVILSSFSPGP